MSLKIYAIFAALFFAFVFTSISEIENKWIVCAIVGFGLMIMAFDAEKKP